MAAANTINENNRRYSPASFIFLTEQLNRVVNETIDLGHVDNNDSFLPVNDNMRIYQPPTQRENRLVVGVDPIDDILSGGLPMQMLNVFMGVSSRSRLDQALEDLIPVNDDVAPPDLPTLYNDEPETEGDGGFESFDD